jgi:hypothetical protein
MAKLRKIVFTIRLSISVRDFAALNEHQIIFFVNFILTPKSPTNKLEKV